MSTKARPRSLTWETALDRFEEHLLARGAAKRTVQDYLRELRLLVEHLRPLLRVTRPREVTTEHLRSYQAGLMTGEAARRGRPVNPGTVAKITATLATFFSWLREGLIPADPTAHLDRPKLARPVGDVLSLPEVQRLLAQPDQTTALGLRDAAMLEVLYGAGLRRNELLSLDLPDLRGDERERRRREERPRRR